MLKDDLTFKMTYATHTTYSIFLNKNDEERENFPRSTYTILKLSCLTPVY